MVFILDCPAGCGGMFINLPRSRRFKSPSLTEYREQFVALVDDFLGLHPSATIDDGVKYAQDFMRSQGVHVTFYQGRNWVTKKRR